MSNLVTGMGGHIKVRSISESRDFYEKLLELTPVFAYGDDEFLSSVPAGVPTAPEKYSGITYELPGGAKIEIADGHIAVNDPKVFSARIESPKVSAMINVASLVPLIQKSILGNPKVTHYYWGTLEAVTRDPDGWVIVLIAPYSDAEFAEVSKLTKVHVVSA